MDKCFFFYMSLLELWAEFISLLNICKNFYDNGQAFSKSLFKFFDAKAFTF